MPMADSGLGSLAHQLWVFDSFRHLKEGRVKPIHFVCVSLMFAGPLALAQTNRVPSVDGPLPLKSTPPTALAQPDPARRGQIVESYGKLPLSFEVNRGQTDAKVEFLSRGSGYTLFLTGDAAVFSLTRISPNGGAGHLPSLPARAQVRSPDVPARNTVLQMNLVKASPSVKVTGEDELPGRSNYFIGNDSKQWRSDVPTYTKVKYEGIYPGVDLLYYGNQRQLEYDFVVSPGADPHRIQFDVRGARNISTDKDGDLVFHFADGELRWRKPVVYQETNGIRQTIYGRYIVRRGHRVGFALGEYDSHRALIIDPAFAYSTYIGGATGGSSAAAVAVDASGNAYLTGYTRAWDFPVTPGAFQTTCPSGQGQYGCGTWGAAFITKMNPTGTALVYSTYLGGNEGGQGSAIAVDASGDAYVTGFTYASNFPTTPGAYQTTCGNCGYGPGLGDAFVAELNPAGSGLVYSTYLGGDTPNQYYNDSSTGGIAIDTSGNVYVAGYTNFSGFPVTRGAFQTKCGSCTRQPTTDNAFVTKFNPTLSKLVYSTFLGGSGSDSSGPIVLDAAGDAYLTGITSSTNFPVTPGAFQTTCSSLCFDAFVTELNPTGSALVYSTYLGGSITQGSGQLGSGIALNASGDAYVTGMTGSPNFPTTTGAFQTTCHGCVNGGSNAFVTEFNPTGSDLVYSTYLGGSIVDQANGIVLDIEGDAYLSGETFSIDFPTTPGAFNTCAGCTVGMYRGFVSEMNPTGTSLVYSTYLTSSGGSGASGIAIDAAGSTYVVGETSSADFPITPGVYLPPCAGSCDGYAFVTKFVPGDQVWPLALSFPSEPIGAATGPQNTVLTNSGTTALAITNVTIVGANKGDFSQNNNCPASLGVGDFCTIAVTFTPTAAGARNATVSIADAAPNSPQTVALSGTGTQSVVTLSPSSLNFSYQTVGITSQPLPVMLTTDGTLNISSIVATAPFAQTNNCATVLPPNGNCIINVTFTPTSVGPQNGTLTISDSGQGSPQIVSLSGTGAQPAATISPTSLNFGIQTLGTTSSSQGATLSNTSQVPLVITSIQIIGADSGDFAQSNNCPLSLPPQSACGISVTFTPLLIGPRTAKLQVTDKAAGSPQTVLLSGVGVIGISFSPPSVTFPSQYVGTSGLPQIVTLTNTGDTVLTITNVAASASFAALSNCGSTVQPGAKCSIGVFFDPATTGTVSGVLTITDNDINGSPQTVPLTGIGQNFSVAASSSSTATVAPGQAANYTVAVAPGGGFNQTVTLTCSGAPLQSSCAVSPSSVKLNGAASVPVTVTVTTAGASASFIHPSGLPRGGNRLALWLAFSGLPGLVLLGSRPHKRQGRQGTALACVLLIVMMLSACGGSSMGGSSGSGSTPAGTYNLTVVGTFTSGSANLVHSTKLTLVVQ